MDDVAVLVGGRDRDVHVEVLHHLAHVAALLADDEAVEVVRHGHILRHWHQVLQVERERGVLFNDALNTFYLRLYGVRHG